MKKQQFLTNKKYVNRYRDEYQFIKESDTVYLFDMSGDSMKWCRFGGKEGESRINDFDLGFIDPSGGPFLEPDGFTIDGHDVVRIFFDNGLKFEVK